MKKVDFTLAELMPSMGRSDVQVESVSTETSFEEMNERCRLMRGAVRKGFTLAEVLITLAIIGIVSAITIPVLVQNVQSKVKTERIKNIRQKLSQGMDRMAVQTGLTGYSSTKDFVQELSKHYKISQICENNNLRACWPVSEVKLKEDGKTWKISKTKKSKNLNIIDSDNWLDTVGIVTGDGVSMILSYKKTCDFNADFDKITMDKKTGISSSLECISGIYDWNGGQSPNKLGEDIQLLGVANGLASSCGAIDVGDVCFSAAFKPKGLSKTECESMISTHGIKECGYEKSDFWAGAVKQCGGVDKLPTMAQLAELAQEMYVTTNGAKPSIGVNQNVYNLTFQTSSPTSLALGKTPSFWLCSREEYNSTKAYGRYIYSTSSKTDGYYRNSGNIYAICVVDD